MSKRISIAVSAVAAAAAAAAVINAVSGSPWAIVATALLAVNAYWLAKQIHGK